MNKITKYDSVEQCEIITECVVVRQSTRVDLPRTSCL